MLKKKVIEARVESTTKGWYALAKRAGNLKGVAYISANNTYDDIIELMFLIDEGCRYDNEDVWGAWLDKWTERTDRLAQTIVFRPFDIEQWRKSLG